MGTLAELKARIADEIYRSDLTSQIAYAISDAVALYQSKRFRFNQTRATFSTADGTEFYTTSVIPDDIAEIDSLRLTINGRLSVMEPLSYSVLEDLASTSSSTGPPHSYAWYANQIRLYPIPDAVYTMTISYLQAIDVPAADGGSNIWTTEAGALIRHAAKRMLASEVTMDSVLSQAAAQSEVLEFRRLTRESQKLETGGLRCSM